MLASSPGPAGLRLALLLALASGATAQEIHATLEHAVGRVVAGEVTWELRLSARDLEEPPTVHLQDWGEWTTRPGYVELVAAEPALAGEGPRWTLADPGEFEGSLELHLRLRPAVFDSELHRRHHLLPVVSETYAFGFAWNVLPNLEVDGEPIAGERILTLRAPEGQEVVTGWEGHAGHGEQTVELEARQGNALIAFGVPTAMADSDEVEVFQFGGTSVVADHVHELVSRLAPPMGAACGRPAARPLRVFVVDTHAGGTGTDHGLRIGFTRGMDADAAESPYFEQMVAHELFHFWLGKLLSPADDSLVWFQEGFTDYLSLWHYTAAGLGSREWFVERLLELDREARERSTLGRLPFTDPTIEWRDGDGPNETMAYKGGAVLALALDVELRARGGIGLHGLIRHLLAAGRTYEEAAIRAWLVAQGLEELDRAAIAGTEVPRAADSLRRLGFRVEERPVTLAYVGIRADAEPFGTVLAVDPAGPAAAAGVEVGDRITGFCNTRHPRPALREGFELEHPFGATYFDPDTDGHRIGVMRAGERLELSIEPRTIEGGVLRRWLTDGVEVDAYFEHSGNR